MSRTLLYLGSKLAGSNGLGAYVTASWNSGTNQYDFTASASPVSQYIP